jgi:glycosyltransferase involved in cell wall biosynthesis
LNPPTITELQDFTLDRYAQLLRYLQSKYKIVPFREVNYEDTPYLILRHDIDISIKDALEMAKIEKSMNIKSTYFVLFSCKFYNLFEPENMAILREISEMGHEIGLHYHLTAYARYNQAPQKTLQLEANLLEQFLGKKVDSIARHGLWARDPFALSRQFINANQPYYRADLFVHESNRAWVTLENLSILLNTPLKRVQLLVHPENWQKDKVNREELLERHVQNLKNNAEGIKKDLLAHYQEDKHVIDYDNAVKDENFSELRLKSTVKSQPNNSLLSILRYNLIHSKIGWQIHNLRNLVPTNLGFGYSTSYPKNAPAVTKNSSAGYPLVSIVITCHNYGNYLADAIKSTINQTYKNLEIIVVDDGSTDGTKKVVESFPVTYFYQQNQGVSNAKTKGVQLSHGDFFICLDADDMLFPKYVEKTLTQMLKKSSIGFVYTGSKVWNELIGFENIWMPRRIFSKYSLFSGWVGAMGPVMVRKAAFNSLNDGFDLGLPENEDLDVCFRLLSSGWKSDLVYAPAHWYRLHRGSLTHGASSEKGVAGAFLNSKYRFRPFYRRIYDLYRNTLGRVESLMKNPVIYIKGIQKKMRLDSQVKAHRGLNASRREELQMLEHEISFTSDMLLEWQRNKQLRQYYENRINFLESLLTTTLTAPVI